MRITRPPLLALVVLVGCIPVPTPLGSLYLIEPLVLLLAVNLLVRSGANLRVPAVAGFALLLPAAAVAHAAVGLHGDWKDTIHNFRAGMLLVAGLIVVANVTRTGEFARQVVVAVGTGMAALVIFERISGITWIGASNASLIAARAAGPLGPGPTATMILAAFALSITGHRWRVLVPQLAALFLLASRAHFAAAAIVIVWELRPASFRPKVALRVGLMVVIAFAVFPEAFARLSDVATSGEFHRSRAEVWSAAMDQTSPTKALIGLGPAGFSHDEPQLRARIVYAHSQYITPWLEEGVAGMVSLVAIVGLALRYARRNDTLGFAVGMLVASIFGEFLLSPAVPAAIGAIATWGVLMTPGIRTRGVAPSDDARPQSQVEGRLVAFAGGVQRRRPLP